MTAKRIFISDIHFGDDARYRDPEPHRRARYIPDEHGEGLFNYLNQQIFLLNLVSCFSIS